MAFRVILIENEVKMSLKLNNLIITKDNDDVWIPLNDISMIVVDNLMTSITTRMLSILAEENIGLIICDKKHMPIGSFITYANHSRASKMLNYQIQMSNELKNDLWDKIVIAKIENQAESLEELTDMGFQENEIRNYALDVIDGDKYNREGTAAKAYFTRLMGTSYSRSNSDILLNSGLDYGYSIIRSYMARILIAYGFNCELGIHHKNEYNSFNFVDDIMEPIRPLLDVFVYKLLDREEYFMPEHRRALVNFINHYIKYNNKKMYIANMLEEYVVQIINSIKNNNINIVFPKISDYIGEKDEI